MQEIASNIYIEDRFLGPVVGAIFLSHGTLLIDAPPVPDDARSWRASITNQSSGLDRLLVYLDAHPDRTLGGNLLDCPAIAHEDAARVFKKRSTLFKNQPLHQGAAWEMAAPLSGVRWRHPVFTFSAQIHIHWDDQPLILQHAPGPAPGASWVWCPAARVVFVGDAVTWNEPPFFHQADLTRWLHTLETLQNEHSDAILVSSRGGALPVRAIAEQIALLRYVAQQLEALAARNAPVEATGDLIPTILSHYDFPSDFQPLYEARLRSGLALLYQRQYRSPSHASEALR